MMCVRSLQRNGIGLLYRHLQPLLNNVQSVRCRNTWEQMEGHWQHVEDNYISLKSFDDNIHNIPDEVDVLIVGGGAMGLSTAFWLKNLVGPNGISVAVIEKDPSYTRAASSLSNGHIWQQFSTSENIQLSLKNMELLRNVKSLLSVLGEDLPDIQFQPNGFMFLATDSKQAAMLKKYNKTQDNNGAQVELLNQTELGKRYPWLNSNDVLLASHGLDNEGYFEPASLLNALRNKALSMGVRYVHGTLQGFEMRDNTIRKAVVGIPMSSLKKPVIASIIINAAGPWAGDVARLAGIGSGPGLLSIPLPVVPVKRYVYCINAPEGPGLDFPLLIDDNGVYCRRDGLGAQYICGRNQDLGDELLGEQSLEVDYKFFEEQIQPHLIHRVPSLSNLKIQSAWAGFHDYNSVDQNAIFGNHPIISNMYFINGFSGHGTQQSLVAGYSVAEQIVKGEYSLVDLSRLHFERFIENKLVFEKFR